MKLALFYDTETTGLPLFSEPSEDPRQPHIVQLAAALVDLDSWETRASLDVIIKPDGWTIPDDVAAIHGLTTEAAQQLGVPADTALELAVDLWRRASVRIAHNESFDARLMRIGMFRHFPNDTALHDEWKGGAALCTQVLSTPILKLPPTAKMIAARRTHHKSANLGEAFEFFTGGKLQGAHRAMVDVQACIQVYRAIDERSTVAA
jgi:DNA polymerase-3 subunit epsilon